MFHITDLEKINMAFSQKAPREIKDLIMDVYPDATIDCNGRAHAPYDGYECEISGKTFRAGEYLPFSDPDENYRVMYSSEAKWPKGLDSEGILHEWKEGTKSQIFAVYAELIKQSKEYSAYVSSHIGAVGFKHTFDLTIEFVKGFSGIYGVTYIHVMKDKDENVVVYKGSKYLGNKDSNIQIVAKIKEHSERDGIKQTIIERPQLVADLEKKAQQKLSQKTKKKSSGDVHLEMLKKGKTDEEIVEYLSKEFPDEEIIPMKIKYVRVHWRRVYKDIPE